VKPAPSDFSMLKQIDIIVRDSLTEFVADVFGSSWKGREREAVSLYAFGFLQRQIRKGGILRDPTQIGIEVTVPSDKSLNPKGRVCKDLVLWREPNMTCWNAGWEVVNFPLMIMEWKAFRLPSSRPQISKKDVEWLRQYSALYPSVFVGYTVSLDLLQRKFRISVTRIEGGSADDHWLEL
jgi:hypothetical protein